MGFAATTAELVSAQLGTAAASAASAAATPLFRRRSVVASRASSVFFAFFKRCPAYAGTARSAMLSAGG